MARGGTARDPGSNRVPTIVSAVLAGTVASITIGSLGAVYAVRESQREVAESTALAISFRDVQNSAAMLALAESELRRDGDLPAQTNVRREARQLTESMEALQATHAEDDPRRVGLIVAGYDDYRAAASVAHRGGDAASEEAVDAALHVILNNSGAGALSARSQNHHRLSDQEHLLYRLTWLVPAGASITAAALGLAWSAMLRRHRELAARVVQNQQRADRDELTGLANRAPLMQALAGAAQSGRHYAVLLLDLDRFKEVNDSRGHAAGDVLLRDIAQALLGSIRSGDLLARTGGDEFTVLLSDPVGAHRVADRLRDGVAKVAADHHCEVTLSVGLTHVPAGSSLGPAEVLAQADAALYGAKRAGRDTVHVHGDAPQATGRH